MEKKMKIFFAVFIFCTALFSCKNNSTTGNEIIVGAILPLTGKYADLGNSAKSGLMLALDDLNASNPKYKIKLLIEDGRSEANVALSAYNKLTKQDNARIIVTISSAFSLSIKPQAIKDNVLLFAIASHPAITENTQGLVFRPCNTSKEECSTIIEQMKSTIDSTKKTWIFYHNSEFGVSFKDQIVSQIGSRITGVSSYDDKLETFKSLTVDALAKKPDNIIAIGFTPSLGALLKTIRESKFTGEIYSNIGFSSASSIAAAGDAAVGVNFVDYKFPDQDPYFVKLNEVSMQKFNAKFSAMSFLSFSALKLIYESAISANSNTDIELFSKFLSTPKKININGIELTSDAQGNIQPGLFIKKN